jgi:hypothetical protein
LEEWVERGAGGSDTFSLQELAYAGSFAALSSLAEDHVFFEFLDFRVPSVCN